jgi:hypothetical protein
VIPHQLLHVLVGGVGRKLGREAHFFAERIRVLAGDAKQVALHVNREAAAEGLSDEACFAFAQGHRDAGGNHDGFDVAL